MPPWSLLLVERVTLVVQPGRGRPGQRAQSPAVQHCLVCITGFSTAFFPQSLFPLRSFSQQESSHPESFFLFSTSLLCGASPHTGPVPKQGLCPHRPSPLHRPSPSHRASSLHRASPLHKAPLSLCVHLSLPRGLSPPQGFIFHRISLIQRIFSLSTELLPT